MSKPDRQTVPTAPNVGRRTRRDQAPRRPRSGPVPHSADGPERWPVMLKTTLGNACLLARPGDRRLWLLDAGAAQLWDLHRAGWAWEPLAELLSARFALGRGAARAYLGELRAQWQAAGLLVHGPADGSASAWPCAPADAGPRLPPPGAAQSPRGAWRLAVADRDLSLAIADPGLRERLAPLVAPLYAPPPALDRNPGAHPEAPVDHLAVHGDASHWTVTGNGTELETGHGHDAALVAILHLIAELGCRTRERLLVVHGAGLVAEDGRGLLLIAPGGSGKSTLAAALNAAGLALLSDDVVPVTPDGQLVGLGLPLCLKAGSWPVLSGCRGELAEAPTVHRYGQAVRYLPPRGPRVERPVPTGRLLFPRYRPGCAPQVRALTPEEALQGVVEAEAVIRDLTQARLAGIARWIGSAPAYTLDYPNLDSALSLVRQILPAGPLPA